MRKLRIAIPCLVTTLALASLSVVSGPVYASSAHGVNHAGKGSTQRNYVCTHNPKPKKCKASSGTGAAAQAAAYATSLANQYNACTPKSSAKCVALLQAFNAAAARAKALAAGSGLPAPSFPSTGGGGTFNTGVTAPAAGTAASAGSGVVGSAGGTSRVATLPATGGGAVPGGSGGSPLLPLAALALVIAGLSVRRFTGRS